MNSDRNYYLIKSSEKLVQTGKAGIGWAILKLAELGSFEAASEYLKKNFHGESFGRHANQVRRFYAIKEGDVMLVPLPRKIAVGLATGKKSHDPSFGDNPDDHSLEMDANQVEIDFPRDPLDGSLLTLPRTALSEGLQRRIRVQGMFLNNLNEFHAEIENIYTHLKEGDDTYRGLRTEILREIEKNLDRAKKTMLENLRAGKTNLQAGGIGLEQLVQKLLQCNGYTAIIPGKRSFAGIADVDIRAYKDEPPVSIDLIVQVKHKLNPGDWGLKQLKAAYDALSEEGLQMVLVTSGEISGDVLDKAEGLGISCIDGEQLVDWIFDSAASLDEETRLRLGLTEQTLVLKVY